MRAIHYVAAGGVVVDGDRVLVLNRPGRNEVRLPKGHIEKGESPQETAVREVREETGYEELEVVADLGYQLVEFEFGDTRVRRDERYFLMRLQSARRLERDPKELQFVPTWLAWERALAELTYDAEREWLHRARRSVAG